MRILFVSNLFPPHHIGGYEIGCSEIVLQMRERGHECHVLTSNYGYKDEGIEEDIYRILTHSVNDRAKAQRLGRIRSLLVDWKNRQLVRRTIRRLKPDVIFMFNPMFLTPGVAVQAAYSGKSTCCFVSDNWLCDWKQRGNRHYLRLKSLYKNWFLKGFVRMFYRLAGLTSSIELPQFNETIFVSEYLKQSARDCEIKIENSKVFHWGIERDKFLVERKWESPARNVIYFGQIVRHKGIETAIRAIAIIQKKQFMNDLKLTIAGAALESTYQEYLHRLVEELGVQDYVNFIGCIARSDLPTVLKEHDILVFPSIWQEPFSIALVEGMTSGLAVVSTDTGGSSEILSNGLNGLRFEADNPEGCAMSILELLKDRGLCAHISMGAVKSTDRLTIDEMADKIELLLTQVSSRPALQKI